MKPFAVLIVCICALSASSKLFAEDEPSAPEIPPGLKMYKGRRIAPTMHFAHAGWLIRDVREREERCSLMLANLGAKPGMTVCDMGCGNGFYALQMAKIVGETGTVLGVDIQPEMLKLMQERAAKQKIKNVKPVQGTLVDPKLPDGKVDIILCADVYHEFSHPEHMLAAMRKSLSPKGVVVLLEFREEDPKVPIRPLHKMSKAQVNKELTANGFKLVKEFDKLPWQHMMFFGRDDSE
ncbi:MAG: SAM-dependent methyltransferase [Planctomycetaceae bacterium]|nr:SAM-dependent methyltransferase [Planctomycetaceae bacterium]